MRTVGNVLWLLLAGLWLALGYVVAGLVNLLPVVTIPFAVQSFKLAAYSLWPFGRAVVAGPEQAVTVSAVGNVLWFVTAGWWLAIAHVLVGVVLCATIVGLPFGMVSFRLARLALAPFGKVIVPAELAPAGAIVVPRWR